MNKKGQALVEFVIILPIFLMLLFIVIDFGKILFSRIELENLSNDVVALYDDGKTKEEIEKFLSMTKDIVILDGPMAVSLFVITEVKVSYKNLRIYTQKDYEYCYYRAENSNESPLAMMSSDLVNFIKKYTNDIG